MRGTIFGFAGSAGTHSLAQSMIKRSIRPLLAAMLLLVSSVAAAAQQAAPGQRNQSSLIGTWTGTATIPLPDSSLVLPVTYTFTQGPSGITGSAFVPGQGTGPISNVVREGVKVRFRVETTQGKLEHDATLGADGAMEGMVNLNNAPVAKFKVAIKK